MIVIQQDKQMPSRAGLGRVAVDLCGEHILCEMNYYRLLRFMPGWDKGITQWSLHRGGTVDRAEGNIHIVQSAPYTTAINLQQDLGLGLAPEVAVRLYHDANMAEIVAWDNHRHWRSAYAYPNKKMYQPNEKANLNRFLYDWLSFYRSSGFISQQICDADHV